MLAYIVCGMIGTLMHFVRANMVKLFNSKAGLISLRWLDKQWHDNVVSATRCCSLDGTVMLHLFDWNCNGINAISLISVILNATISANQMSKSKSARNC